MLNIPESIKNLFERDDIQKNFRVHFPDGQFEDITNENVVEESVEFTESLCSQNNFRFGLTEASVLTFETVGAGNMFGMTIEASMEIDISTLTAAEIAEIKAGTYDGALVLESESDIGFGFYRVPYGRFYVDSCPRNHQAMAHRTVTAYSTVQLEPLDLGNGLPNKTLKIDLATLEEYLNPQMEWTEATAPRESKFYSADSSPTEGNVLFVARTKESGREQCINAKEFAISIPTTQSKKYDVIVKTEYERMPEIDDNGIAFATALAKVAPNGYTYGSYPPDPSSSSFLQLYSDTKHFVTLGTNLFSAAIYGAWYSNGDVKPGRFMPQIMAGPGTYLFSEDNAYDVKSGKPLNDITVHQIIVSIPTFVAGSEKKNNVLTSLTGTSSLKYTYYTPQTWPIVDDATRPNADNIKVYYKVIPRRGITLTFNSEAEQTIEYTGKYYYYNNSDTAASLFGGALELAGQFGKVDRVTGKFERVNLDTSAPVSISPSQYSELWWDEYDISKIGKVYFETEAGGNVVNLGAGESIYDMTDNKLIHKVTGEGSLDAIIGIIRDSFQPATENCYFTPAELTMHGKPWIEAGDALSITADDGTEVNTFALRHTLRGIQYITSEIEATSGSIIGVEG